MKHFLGKALFTFACAGLMTAASAAYKAEYKLSVVPGARLPPSLPTACEIRLMEESTLNPTSAPN